MIIENFTNNGLKMCRRGYALLLRNLYGECSQSWIQSGERWFLELYPAWTRRLRICAPDFFPVYFRLGVPSSEAIFIRIEGASRSCICSQRFGQSFDRDSERFPVSGAKIISFLERLEDISSTLPSETAKGLLEALISVGDELDRITETKPGNLFGMSVMIDRSIIRLLPRLEEPDD